MKTCSRCGQQKPVSLFWRRATSKDGLTPHCKACGYAVERRYRERPGVRAGRARAERARVARLPPDKDAERRQKLNRRTAAYMATPAGRLLDRARKGLRRAKIGKAGKRTFALLGFSINEFQIHLERQFLPGMGWHNMGEWHIDHIVPVASFDLSDPIQFARCWGLPNLRPLWGKDNMRKQARREFLV